MNIVLCESAGKREFTAGNKARTDTVQILQRAGYKHIPFFISKTNKIIVFLQIILSTLQTIFQAGKNENIFIQYPYNPVSLNKVLINALSIFRKVKGYIITLLIHDSMGLRNIKNDSTVLYKEIKLFDKVDLVICHNEIMKKVFLEAGGIGNYAVLGPFDYLYDGPLAKISYAEKPTIIIAGNLSAEKCGYVYHLSDLKNCNFNLYGINYSGEKSDNICYKGSYAPNELIEKMEGTYGLVWDGESIETCSGVYGNYLRYNNPHKFSLYMAAGIPVIVWDESALASYVMKYKLGICVKSLKDIESIRISFDDYEKIKQNIIEYRKRIIEGKHLADILASL